MPGHWKKNFCVWLPLVNSLCCAKMFERKWLFTPSVRHISAGQRNISILSKTSFVGLDNLRSVQVANSPKLTGLETGLFASLQGYINKNTNNIIELQNTLTLFELYILKEYSPRKIVYSPMSNLRVAYFFFFICVNFNFLCIRD